jgi:holin-like protein
MLNGFSALLAVQLLGELLVRALSLPVSGPICGMALLVCWLAAYGPASETTSKNLSVAADAILPNMAMLFVPVGVGVMAHWPLLAVDWFPLAAALAASSMLTLFVTAWTYQWADRQIRKPATLREAPERPQQPQGARGALASVITTCVAEAAPVLTLNSGGGTNVR